MSTYSVSRSVTVAAPSAQVHALVDDFHAWPRWSPWEGLDDDLERHYSGPDRGVGAAYSWQGNRKAGAGSMEITSSTAEAVGVALEFLKPFRSSSAVTFHLVPSGAGTEVTWQMTGEQTGLMGVFGKVVSMDRLIGKDFEKGLAQLKAAAESDVAGG